MRERTTDALIFSRRPTANFNQDPGTLVPPKEERGAVRAGHAVGRVQKPRLTRDASAQPSALC